MSKNLILVVSVIEIGGRKGLQVITRAIVWKRLKSFWYWALFIPVFFVTIGLFYQSFQLSTKGTKQTIEQSVEHPLSFNDSLLIMHNKTFVNQINEKYNKQVESLKTAFNANYNAKEKQFDSRLVAIDKLLIKHTRDKKDGYRWAQSHIDKQTKIKSEIQTEKQDSLALVTTTYTANLKTIEKLRTNELTSENKRYLAALETARKALNDNYNNERSNAKYWANLMGSLVGVLITIAFVSIVTVEIFRRGSGIEIGYIENRIPPNLANVFLTGLNNRVFNLLHNVAVKWYVDKKEVSFINSDSFENQNTINKKNDLIFTWNTGQRSITQKRDFKKLFGYGENANSLNLKTEKNINAVVPIYDNNSGDYCTVLENEFNVDNKSSKISRIGDRTPILKANLDNNRNKEKHKKKQRKRIIKFYENYVKKHGKKPSYQIISNALNIAERSVGNYVRELKKEGTLNLISS